MFIERTGSWGTFTTDYLDGRVRYQLKKDRPIHELLFEETKEHYQQDDLFTTEDKLEISGDTFRRIVKELERFNLSATGDDVKGLAFEKFLGDTFRGNLGQFFTPRPIVDFMVELLDPGENELICDPASGSGGFLIRAFEHIRRKIHADIQGQKDAARKEIEARKLAEDKEIALVEKAFAKLNRDLDPEQADPPSRVRRLAYDCIFGTDAEPRAARTSKMNMIMHGDGHGGIHYHDGFVDINGIYAGRFDLVLTNPPFGSTVGRDQKFGSSDQTRVPNDAAYLRRCRERYGSDWSAHHALAIKRMEEELPILDAYEIGKDKPNRDTEILFLERCLNLLKPGGRMGIVLPDGNLNNPSLAWLRRWAEGKARLLAVVSLPEETFVSADATVKASLVFLQRFNAKDEKVWAAAWTAAHQTHDGKFNAERSRLCTEFGARIACADRPELRDLLAQLAKLGLTRTPAAWRQDAPPAYHPQGVGATRVGKPKWIGEAKDKKRARELRRAFDAAWTEADELTAEKILRQLRAALRKVAADHNATLWQHVRAAFDYPVFTAAPELVGITSTGADGPNQLPEVMQAWREFAAWLRAGAAEKNKPDFAK
jgi:type I restriction enzyme M protein